MTYENAVHTRIQPVDPRRSIHLVYSRNDGPVRVRPENVAEMPRIAGSRRNDGMDTLLLAAAAIGAPMVWVGHALFEWIRTH